MEIASACFSLWISTIRENRVSKKDRFSPSDNISKFGSPTAITFKFVCSILCPRIFWIECKLQTRKFFATLKIFFERNAKIFVPVNRLFQNTIGILKLKQEGFFPVWKIFTDFFSDSMLHQLTKKAWMAWNVVSMAYFHFQWFLSGARVTVKGLKNGFRVTKNVARFHATTIQNWKIKCNRLYSTLSDKPKNF